MGAAVALSGPAVADAATAAATAGSSAPSQVTVIPPDDPTAPAADHVLVAGTSGFVHQRQGVDGLVWTDYATGATHALPVLSGVAASAVLPAGGDAFAFVDASAGVLHVGTPEGRTTTAYQLPAGFTVKGVADNATRALVVKAATTTSPAQIEVLGLGTDGGVTEMPVTGLPDGAWPYLSPLTEVATDGATHAVTPYRVPGSTITRYALLDLETGAATDIPGLQGYVSRLIVTPGDVVWAGTSGLTTVVRMLPQQAVLDGSAATMTPATVTLPTNQLYALAPTGEHLLAVQAPQGVTGRTGAPGQPVLDYSFTGGSPTTLLGSDADFPVVAPDGAVLATGGADTTVSAVHRYVPAADGGDLADTTVLPLPPVQAQNAGLTVAHGFLRHIVSTPVLGGGALLSVHNHELVPGAGIGDAPWGGPAGGTFPSTTLMCQSGSTCVRSVDGNWYGTSYLLAGATGSTEIRSSVDVSTSAMTIDLPFTGGRLVDVSTDYQLVEGGSTARQYVIDTGHEQIISSGPITGAALWDDTLWQAPTTSPAGTLTASDLTAYPSPKVVRTLSTGTACRPTELQVSQHWLYWACGVSGPAGVVDLSTGHHIPVPSGQALLGDGYLVQHDSATSRLLLVDFHTGTAAAAQALADLPASTLTDDRSITWAVDRFSGDVAYVGADRSVHVLSTGVPASAPTAVTGQSDPLTPGDAYFGTWNLAVRFDRPVDAWKVTIADVTNRTVHTITGGARHSTLSTSWDGRLADGSPAFSGPYHWNVSATVQGVTVPVGGASGSFTLDCGTLVFRSYDCDGNQALLGVTPGGQGHWYQATSSGGLRDGGWTDSWSLGTGSSSVTSAIVPFGDINGDRRGDLLARDGSGVLTAYLGIGEAYFDPQSTDIKKVRIGGGWNIYNALVGAGDLNRDGRADLLACDGSGQLWRYTGTGKSSFASRVRIGTGWNIYTRIIGAGDLNGDGAGDLLAVDASGNLWRYDGTGTGTFRSRVRIGTDWGIYNSIIGIGDLNHDGHNDLVARDRSGNLWRYDGTGTGTFRSRVKIGWGWGMYAGLY